jgi:hypothetical protein
LALCWTIGESGKLNYGWEVDGAAPFTHWQGGPGEIGTPLHPTRKILADPAVYEFAEPLRVTYPPWYDPAYWYAGISPKIKPLAELKAIFVYGRYSLLLLSIVPGLLPAAIAAAFLGSLRIVGGILLNFWYLLAPATGTILLYCFVFADSRYVAGSVVIIGTIALAALTSTAHNKKWANVIKVEAVLLTVLLICQPVVTGLHSIISPATYAAPKQIEIAAEMRELGLSPGDRIGYIGAGINAYWALCDGVRIIAEVPMTYGREQTFQRSVTYAVGEFNPLDSVIAAMKSAGARAIVADAFPARPDLGAWHVLHVRDSSGLTGNRIMVLFSDAISSQQSFHQPGR